MDQPEAPEHVAALSSPPAPSAAVQAHPQAIDALPGPAPVHELAPEPVEVRPASPSPEPLPDEPAAQPFGAALAPVLVESCGGRLSNPSWFRTDWQRGGALTGYADWVDAFGQTRQAVVKMPVPPNERYWLVQLAAEGVTPRVFAHGSELGGYDLAWVVMERLPHGPIGGKWGAAGFEHLADAAARFYAAAWRIPLTEPKAPRDWEAQLKLARDQTGRSTIADSQRWRKALKKAGKKLPGWLDQWLARDRGCWCHGDLHPGNAMTRNAPPQGPAVLFDLASVKPGHWVEDAVYLEHLYWANPDALHGTKPVKHIAQQMKAHGLTPGDNWPELANIYRAMLAMVAPAYRNKPGGNAQAAASLKVLEGLV